MVRGSLQWHKRGKASITCSKDLEVADSANQNVPPVWRTVQFLWEWLDTKFEVTEREELDHLRELEIDANAEPWWEAMVAEIIAREGKLNLA